MNKNKNFEIKMYTELKPMKINLQHGQQQHITLAKQFQMDLNTHSIAPQQQLTLSDKIQHIFLNV